MRKFLTNLLAVVASAGLKDKFDRKELTKEDQAALIEAYNKAHGAGAFANDFANYQTEQSAQSEAFTKTLAELAGITGVEAGTEGTPDGLAQILASVKELKGEVATANATIEKLSKQGAEVKPVATVADTPSATGMHTKEYAFGIQNPFFAASRRYNSILINGRIDGNPTENDRKVLETDAISYAEKLSERYGELRASGRLNLLKQAKVDISQLSSDTEIGTRQFTIRQDMVIARIVSYPSLAGLFNTVSNIQSGQVITNVLFDEVSQAYQSGEVYKGNVDFQPEKAIVDKVMSKVRFEDMSTLETAYLNYLNHEGSDPVKWTLLEWLILSLAEKINSERIERSIRGCYVKPVKGESAPAILGSTGVIYRILSLYDSNKALPFDDEELADYDASNIGDVFQFFAKKIAARRPNDFKRFVIYANAAHQPMYMEWYRNKYGQNTDFTGTKDVVPNYNMSIRWVPAMGDLKLIFATVQGNIELLQNVPGEEYKTMFERRLEEVIAYSYWMEGSSVGFAGRHFKSKADLKANKAREQYLFFNLPSISAAADATTVDTESAELEDLGFLIRTSANTKATVLTDIVNAKVGVVYRIECGDLTNATKIEKSGKFSEVEAWTPAAVGDYIYVYYDAAKGKFFEASRG